MSVLGYVSAIIFGYVVPFVFAIGLIFLIYGIIQYFIIGPEEEPTREEGRQHFIKAFVWFLLGVLIYLVVFALTSFVSWVAQFAVEGETEQRLQRVPNVPDQRN